MSLASWHLQNNIIFSIDMWKKNKGLKKRLGLEPFVLALRLCGFRTHWYRYGNVGETDLPWHITASPKNTCSAACKLTATTLLPRRVRQSSWKHLGTDSEVRGMFSTYIMESWCVSHESFMVQNVLANSAFVHTRLWVELGNSVRSAFCHKSLHLRCRHHRTSLALAENERNHD